MVKTALVTGITGMDGYWLSKMLIELGYTVHGFVRRQGFGCLKHLPIDYLDKITMHSVDTTDKFAVDNALMKIRPAEIYHLAAFSSVRNSWKSPELTFSTNVLGTLNLLNGILCKCPEAKMYFAGSSEQFGDPVMSPQNELTPFNPLSPYGISKTAAYHLCRSYRDAYKLRISMGISYNHDSFCRPTDFVMAKICQGAAHIKQGKAETITLGGLDMRRDFGYAKDFTVGYWNALQGDPDEFVFATGELHSIRDICELAFKAVDIPIKWQHGKTKAGEVAVDSKGNIVIQVSYDNFRPSENKHALVGDASKAIKMGVFRTTVKFDQIVEDIVKYHMKG